MEADNTFPSIRWHRLASGMTNSTQVLVGQTDFQPALCVVEGLDVVDSLLVTNNLLQVVAATSGPLGISAPMFQCIIYDTSQASFQWRGSLPLFPGSVLSVIAFAGNWSIHAWGHIEPQFTLSP